MAFFNWDEELSTHIQAFDADHKQLIYLLNEVYDQVFQCENLDEERELTEKTLGNLLEYVNYHFSAEEQLMVKLGYPEYIKHKEQHDYYVAEINKIVIEHKQGGEALSFTVFMLLKDWIVKHILGDDKKYIPLFQEKGIT